MIAPHAALLAAVVASGCAASPTTRSPEPSHSPHDEQVSAVESPWRPCDPVPTDVVFPPRSAENGVHPDLVGLWYEPGRVYATDHVLAYDGCCVTIPHWSITPSLAEAEFRHLAVGIAFRTRAAWQGDDLVADSPLDSGVVARRVVDEEGTARLVRVRGGGPPERQERRLVRAEALAEVDAIGRCVLAARTPLPPSGTVDLACAACPE